MGQVITAAPLVAVSRITLIVFCIATFIFFAFGVTLPLIAVTGSNGKTTVTQMLAAILAAHAGSAALATRCEASPPAPAA